ncbi:MFS transporter [Aneurinibacillus aneurinilyticus]|uniref:Uncharacterized protein n=1 Tax=Aneurinibacillus aneurinilyticus ATCC 12856 TaxID=649747 RepID=U1Y8T0_ANEAE|nr:MFS transporter [Aneurinibacillus aneurinilyticus]ERI07231.1 hypothetical protein HMPREF0083_04702 [Aneurinibacillus aneurinilyticus ATCC 12856]MED0706836.1 MFS transporter [Aneurinibacillus aneurinilyticus]MED0725911.1 MFS transporter [Aneurinibacillus aneurinilyticus]MED0730378.1 MFS transporter [Aneurinibacillus aneurinilyticus]MED0739207.1 MFS transporter [Aneurinibacillus aneurinilyticus]
MPKRSVYIIILTLFLCSLAAFASADSDATADSIINNLYPTEKDMKIDVPGMKPAYKEAAPENYKWDTALQIVEMNGIIPQWNGPSDTMDNSFASMIFRWSVAIVRMGIFIFQLGFSTNIFADGIKEIEGQIQATTNTIYGQVFSLASLFTMIFVLIKWINGEKGKMMKLFFGSFILSGIMMGLIQNIGDVTREASKLSDGVSIMTLNIANLESPSKGEQAQAGGIKRMMETTNMLWKVIVDDPWTIGQFGSVDAPQINVKESNELKRKGVTVSTGGTWKTEFLKYEPGSDERKALVAVLADQDLEHSSPIASKLMHEIGPPVRTQVGWFALINSILSLILFGVVAGLMFVSGLLLLGGISVSPFAPVLPLLGEWGMRVLRTYGVFMLRFLLLKVTATLYLSIIMLLMYIVSKFSFHYIVKQIIILGILVTAIILSPKVWKSYVQGLAVITGMAKRATERFKKRGTKEKVENVFGQHSRRNPRLTNKGPNQNTKANATEELMSLQRIKRENPERYASSGLATRERQLQQQIRNENLANMGLPQLQAERKMYENRLNAGERLSASERQDLSRIQEMERNRIRSMMSAQDRVALDRIWGEGQSLHKQQNALLQQQLADPTGFLQRGGDLQLQHLQSQLQGNQLRENELLSAYARLSGIGSADRYKYSESEREARSSLRNYLGAGSQGVLNRHLANEALQAMDRRRMNEIEAMGMDELRNERGAYEARLSENEVLSPADRTDLEYIQHTEWQRALENLGQNERSQVNSLYDTGRSLEAELAEFSRQQHESPALFAQRGGRSRVTQMENAIAENRSELQSLLIASGAGPAAEIFRQHAENRDIQRDQEVEQAQQEFGMRERQLRDEWEKIERVREQDPVAFESNPMAGRAREVRKELNNIELGRMSLSELREEHAALSQVQQKTPDMIERMEQIQNHEQERILASVPKDRQSDLQSAWKEKEEATQELTNMQMERRSIQTAQKQRGFFTVEEQDRIRQLDFTEVHLTERLRAAIQEERNVLQEVGDEVQTFKTPDIDQIVATIRESTEQESNNPSTMAEWIEQQRKESMV